MYSRRHRSENEVIPTTTRCDHEAQETPAVQAQGTLPSVIQSDLHESSPQNDGGETIPRMEESYDRGDGST